MRDEAASDLNQPNHLRDFRVAQRCDCMQSIQIDGEQLLDCSRCSPRAAPGTIIVQRVKCHTARTRECLAAQTALLKIPHQDLCFRSAPTMPLNNRSRILHAFTSTCNRIDEKSGFAPIKPHLIRGHFAVWLGTGPHRSVLVSTSPARRMRSSRTARRSECKGESFLIRACDATACG